MEKDPFKECFPATNDIFAENAWYFRNALVRAIIPICKKIFTKPQNISKSSLEIYF